MIRHVLYVLAGLCLLMPVALAQPGWKATETVKTYPVSGRTGIELYRSIGENGPALGPTRAIAHTTFDLKWSRNYQRVGNACTLASAKPFLTIIYTLPKPSNRLPADTARLWETFIEGIRTHEKVHGEQMKEMVDRIIRTTVGLTVENDPECKKIRQEINTPLGAASEEQRRRSREFDQMEMRDGGNVHLLVLDLVNGG